MQPHYYRPPHGPGTSFSPWNPFCSLHDVSFRWLCAAAVLGGGGGGGIAVIATVVVERSSSSGGGRKDCLICLVIWHAVRDSNAAGVAGVVYA